MPDALFVEGVLLPLRTGAALLAALAGGLLIGASGPVGTATVTTGGTTGGTGGGTGTKGARGLASALAIALTGVLLGLVLPNLADADTLGLAATGAGLVAGVLVAAAPVPTRLSGAGALAGALALLAGQAAFARFLPGELPGSVHAGAGLGLALALVLPAAAVHAARASVRSPALRRAVEVGTRVLGSWVAAVALLLLALALAPR